MTVQERYEAARKMYADIGVDTDAAIAKLKEIPVSLHCWQGDDVTGFDHDGPLAGGIQTTGNYPGKAKTPEQLMQDMEEAMSLMPGKKKFPAVGQACQQHTAEQQQWCAPFADGRVPEPQEQGIGSNKGEQPAQQLGSLPDGLRPQRDILNGR